MSLQTTTEYSPDNGEVINISKTYYPFYNDVDTDDPSNLVDCPNMSFRFHCSGGEAVMRWLHVEYKCLNTGQKRIRHSPRYATLDNVYYNDDIFKVMQAVPSVYGNSGEDWQNTVTLFQTDPTTITVSNPTGEGLYDIYFGRGKVKAVPEGGKATASAFYIDTGISNLNDVYRAVRGQWQTYRGDDKPTESFVVGGTYLEITHENLSGEKEVQRRLVKTYDKKTGYVTFENAFSFIPSEGTTYKMYCNYIVDKVHYYKLRAKPQTALNFDFFGDASAPLYVKTTFKALEETGQKSGLKCYKYYLYKRTDDTVITPEGDSKIKSIVVDTRADARSYIVIPYTPTATAGRCIRINGINRKIVWSKSDENKENTVVVLDDLSRIYVGNSYAITAENLTLIDESERIFNYKLEHTFYDREIFGAECKVVCEMTTQDNAVYTAESYVLTTAADYSAVDNIAYQILEDTSVLLGFDLVGYAGVTKGSVYIYRTSSDGKNKLISVLDVDGASRYYSTDHLAGNKQTYTYRIYFAPEGANSVFYAGSAEIKTNWAGWAITSVAENGQAYNADKYSKGNTFLFRAAAEGNDIETILGLVKHESTNSKPVITRTSKRCEQGTFTAALMSVDLATGNITDDIKRVKAWTDFITADSEFILKSNKGDVWIVSLVESSISRRYEQQTLTEFTTVTYSWTETNDPDKVVI